MLYKNSGELRIDTSFVITSIQLEKWKRTVDIVINKMIDAIEYSQMALESRGITHPDFAKAKALLNE
ncbi:MAG: hypothetical protein KKA07_08305 [Bacteroidetes bacterium]|nr:hypothetical protein [Bacteroidota bacterium]MBU1719062.1 hypothetical protein [Bacteroidota bacterium]